MLMARMSVQSDELFDTRPSSVILRGHISLIRNIQYNRRGEERVLGSGNPERRWQTSPGTIMRPGRHNARDEAPSKIDETSEL